MTRFDHESLARRLVDMEHRLAAFSRTRQLGSSSVTLVDGSEVPLSESVGSGTDTSRAVAVISDVLADVDDISDAVIEQNLAIPEWVENAGQNIAWESSQFAVELAQKMELEVGKAVEEAADAKATADGKNARRRGVSEPAPPEGGWVQGDQWVRDVLDEDNQPRAVEVLVWNGNEFVHESTLTGEVLVIGTNGHIRLADGVVTSRSLVADAVDGMTITGAMMRTAQDGQRVQLDVNGLRGFDADEAETFTLNTSQLGAEFNFGETSHVNIAGKDGARTQLFLSRGNRDTSDYGQVGVETTKSFTGSGAVYSSDISLGTGIDGLEHVLRLGTFHGPGGADPQSVIASSGGPLAVKAEKLYFDSSEVRHRGDHGWFDLPYEDGYQAGTAAQAQVCRVGGVVFFRGGAHKTSGTYVNDETLVVPNGGFPQWARPTQNYRFGGGASGRRPAYLLITPAGGLIVCPDPANTMPSWIAGATSYPQ